MRDNVRMADLLHTNMRDGGSSLCFVRDPDQYRIELIEKA